jgi:hypothetical protein
MVRFEEVLERLPKGCVFDGELANSLVLRKSAFVSM